MREVTGRRGLVANFKLHKTVVGGHRCCQGRIRLKHQGTTALRCTAYRSGPEDVAETKQEPGQARSRLLTDKKSLLQSHKQPRSSRLIRRTEAPPKTEAPSETQQPPSRLLQRSPSIKTATQGLSRSTDTLRKSRGGADTAGKPAKQSNDRVKQRNDSQNGSTNKRFSQEAGKLSKKDWQVQHCMWPAWL